jgi:glutamine amidotransferase
VHKALVKVGASVKLVTRPEELGNVRAVVLPGVGAFDDCMHALQRQELGEATRLFIQSGKLFLAICVGYQALFNKSEEFNSTMPGLGVFEGTVVKFSETHGLKIPQIGWNRLEKIRTDCPLFRGVPEGSYAYFVHSFYPKPSDTSIIASQTSYGEFFASSVWRDNVFATQFHPEKSQLVGLRLLSNFVEMAQAGVSSPGAELQNHNA